MKKLLITLLLISPFSFADWGDVYYCQETHSSEITLEGKPKNHKLENFTFKLDKTKNAMVFGKKGFFRGSKMKLRVGIWNFPSKEQWQAEKMLSKAFFQEGKFLYSDTGPSGITSKIADCEKF